MLDYESKLYKEEYFPEMEVSGIVLSSHYEIRELVRDHLILNTVTHRGPELWYSK